MRNYADIDLFVTLRIIPKPENTLICSNKKGNQCFIAQALSPDSGSHTSKFAGGATDRPTRCSTLRLLHAHLQCSYDFQHSSYFEMPLRGQSSNRNSRCLLFVSPSHLRIFYVIYRLKMYDLWRKRKVSFTYLRSVIYAYFCSRHYQFN